jgi:hypothetical protein
MEKRKTLEKIGNKIDSFFKEKNNLRYEELEDFLKEIDFAKIAENKFISDEIKQLIWNEIKQYCEKNLDLNKIKEKIGEICNELLSDKIMALKGLDIVKLQQLRKLFNLIYQKKYKKIFLSEIDDIMKENSFKSISSDILISFISYIADDFNPDKNNFITINVEKYSKMMKNLEKEILKYQSEFFGDPNIPDAENQKEEKDINFVNLDRLNPGEIVEEILKKNEETIDCFEIIKDINSYIYNSVNKTNSVNIYDIKDKTKEINYILKLIKKNTDFLSKSSTASLN